MKVMKKTAGKSMLVALAVVLTGAMLVGMMGCSNQSNEEVIRTAITEELEQIKNLDQAMLDEMMDENAAMWAEVEQYVDLEEYLRAWLTGFDYSLGEVKVDGSNATVELTVTCKSLTVGIQNWFDDIMVLTEDPEIANLSEQEIEKKLGSMLIDSIKDAPMETNTGELPYTLNGNTWEPAAGHDSAMAALLGLM